VQTVADSGTTTTLVDAVLTQADGYWNGALLIFRTGTNAGRTAIITDFDAATDTLTFTPAVPDAVTTEGYVLVPGLGHADITAISQDATAADNLELQYDGTGLLGDTFPLRQDQGASIGTAQAGGADNAIVLADASAFANNTLIGNTIFIHTGTGAGQSRSITANVLSTDTCTVDRDWIINPDATSQYEIHAGNVTVAHILVAALARFATEDTSVSTAASGSVSKLAQFTLGAGTAIVQTLDGTVYCSESDINQVYGGDNVQKWADLNNNEDADEITARINRAITVATNGINDILRGGRYALPITDTTAAVALIDLCATLAGVWLYESRGVEDFDPETGRAVHKLVYMRDRATKKLEAIRANRIQLDVEKTTRKGTASPRSVR